ncbi:MAG: extracellular solute-binding protein [Clostridia bacterium]|jgi:multiple sugar transport system substrate-binding protein
MRMPRPFTLFLCIGVALFMVFGWRLVQNRVGLNLTRPEAVEKQWEGVISLWDYPRPFLAEGSSFGWMRERIREFERMHPGVFIELYPLTWGEGRKQLDLAVDRGTCPDIAPVGDNLGYAARGVLEPLDQFIAPNRVIQYREHVLTAVSHNGAIWGIPVYCAVPNMLLNLDAFEEAGVEPPENGRWTYDEFVSILQRLTLDRDGDGKPEQYGLGSYISNGYYNLWGILFSDGWRIYDPVTGRYTVNTTKAVSGMEKLSRLVHEYGVVKSDLALCTQAKAWKDFAVDKKVAVYPEGPWAAEEMRKLQSEGRGFECGTALYPAGDSGTAIAVGDVAAYGVFKQQDPAKKRMCIEFILYIADSLEGEKAAKAGLLPVLKDDPAQRNEAQGLETIMVIPKLENWHLVEDILNGCIRRVVLGQQQPAEALEEAQREIDLLSTDAGIPVVK